MRGTALRGSSSTFNCKLLIVWKLSNRTQNNVFRRYLWSIGKARGVHGETVATWPQVPRRSKNCALLHRTFRILRVTLCFRPLIPAALLKRSKTCARSTWSEFTSARTGALLAARSRRSLLSCTRTLRLPAKSSVFCSSAETETRSRFKSAQGHCIDIKSCNTCA